MNLNKIVTSKELSEKIAKYKRGESLFWWVGDELMSSREIKQYDNNSDEIFFAGCGCCSGYLNNTEKSFPAYTATELGELMKDVDKEIIYNLVGEFFVSHNHVEDMLLFTTPNSIGEIYLYLLKSGVIK